MAPFEAEQADLLDNAAVSEDASVAHLLDLAAKSDKTIVVLDRQARKVGLITREILLSWISHSGVGKERLN
jgi:hypothetical protein